MSRSPRRSRRSWNGCPSSSRAYGPEGLSEKEMVSYGVTQRTLSQFIESGWKLLEQFTP